MVIGPGARFMAGSALAFSAMGVCVKLTSGRLPRQEVVLARAVIALALSWGFLAHAGVSPWGRNRGLLLLLGVGISAKLGQV